MHSSVLWLLAGLAAVVFAVWRIAVSRRRAQEMRASREAAMAIALAQAHEAAKEAKQARTGLGNAGPTAAAAAATPAITRTVRRPAPAPVAPPATTAPATSTAAPATDGKAAARAAADRVIAAEAARRSRAAKVARVESDRRAQLEADLVAKARADAAAKLAAAKAAEAEAAAAAARAAEAAAAAAAAVAPAPTAPPAPVAPAAPAVKSPAETLIMLADDSKMVRIKTSRLLEGHAYRVVTAVDGLDAVRQLESVRPDLVITDVDMPGMDGFGLTRHLRANASTAHIPIVMITSAEDRHRDDATRAGVGLVLGKPYPEDALIAHIRSFRFTQAVMN